MNPKLQQAVEIFKELGWQNATPDQLLQLPLGTPEQQRTALAGLKSGEWGGIVQLSERSYGYRSHVDVDEFTLSLFAVRVGIDARRAAVVLRARDNNTLADVIASRGAKYAADFIRYACVSSHRLFAHSATAFGNAAVRLVDRLTLDIPQNVEYIKDWAVYAAAAMGLPSEVRRGEVDLPDIDIIERRFAQHIEAGIAAGTPATGPFGKVLPAGVKRGWLAPDRAVELCFAALDAAVRPGDRKVWLAVLDELGVGDEAYCARSQSLVPLLATGDTALVVRLAPVLLAGAPGEQLAEVLLASLAATAKKARLAVLRAALDRPAPQNAEELAPTLSLLAEGTDRAVATAAAKLMAQWHIAAEAPPEEAAQAQGLWQATPPLWQVPPFEQVAPSPEALTELAAEMVRRPAMVHDIHTERFLAMANAVARQDAQAARTSLQGLRPGSYTLLSLLHSWCVGETPVHGFDNEKRSFCPLPARNYVACLHLGEVPCLLSTPSLDDLSITVPDLAARLALYGQEGADAQEADLFLALARLNPATKTPQATAALQKPDVRVVLQSGQALPQSAGQTVLRYLDDPFKEPQPTVNKYGNWSMDPIALPGSMAGFPDRLSRYVEELFSTFPLWGDCALRSVGWDSEVYHEKGLILRQVARRAAPLPPGAAVNLLAAQRSSTPQAAQDAMLAVREAWQRGLLAPHVADIAFLDWTTKPPAHLAALAQALEGLLGDGILSVVWPLLDALVAASLKAPRLLAGTAELAELILACLPEVELACERGLADPGELSLPGVRELALRSGSSRAVVLAREIAQRLPPMDAAPEPASAAPAMDPPFEALWPATGEGPLPIEDGVALTVGLVDPDAPAKQFLFTLALPGDTGRVYQVVKPSWRYDLESEGQCRAYAATPGDTALVEQREHPVWLHWDEEQGGVVAAEYRNWRTQKDAPLSGDAPPLPRSLLTVVVGLLAQDGDAVYFAPRLLKKLIEMGQIGPAVIRAAARTLLRSPVVSPAKLVRTLEKDSKLLPVLWPMLTECVCAAGQTVAGGGAPPVWVNRVLDVALRSAPYLREAARRGLIPAPDAQWRGLSDIAEAKAKSAAVAKAKKLAAALAE